MGDWIGLGFFVLLIAAVLIGLKVLSKPRTRTSDEFERNAAENKTMLGAMMNALHDVTDPSAVKAREVHSSSPLTSSCSRPHFVQTHPMYAFSVCSVP